MKRLVAVSLLFAAVSLSACANSIPPLNFSVPNVGPSAHKIDAEVRSITITPARPDEKTGPLPLGIETSTLPIWKTAVEEALNRMAIFKDDAPKKVSLSIKVLKIDVPGAGLSFTTTTEARYELIDRATGAIIYTTSINAAGTTPGDYAFLGLARARESVNRSVQNNIAEFLQALETVDISKPMFPTASNAPLTN
jgi:hypothetical protein